MQPHTRALVLAFLRQTRGALAAIELWVAEDDKLNQNKQPENQRTLRLPKNKV